MTPPPQKSVTSSRRPVPQDRATAPAPGSDPSAPPPPPRQITAAARRRSWTDPVIRFWLLATIVLVAIGCWFVFNQIVASRSEQWLIANGFVVEAKVVGVNNESRTGAKYPPGSHSSLTFDWKDQTINIDGVLSSNDYVTTGEIVQLRIDPNDPTNWTDRTAPEPLGRRLIAGAVIIPAVAITLMAALLLRRRLLGVWRNAQAALYAVVETRYSALAPQSHTVRCVLATNRDPTIVVVYLPARFPRPQRGDLLWLIRRPGNAKAAIAAIAFI
ncbi:MAG: hypothetical protein M3O30_12255 [Planctomycetota bacterium]|nr:hypothetical protein [Planctomycetota bacterium]